MIILATPWENVSSGMCGERRPRSACASAQSGQGVYCPLTESLDTTECMNGDFFFFFFFFDLGFTALSRIFHLYRADRSSKLGENRSTRRKTT